MSALPKYGIVRWRDAAGRRGKVRKDRLTLNAPLREDFGWLWMDAEGTIQVLHNRVVADQDIKDGEYTLIPYGWWVEVIPLTPGPAIKPAPISQPEPTSQA